MFKNNCFAGCAFDHFPTRVKETIRQNKIYIYMEESVSSSAAEGYKQASFSRQKRGGEAFIQTDVCPQVGDVILDLGCGTGELSAYLAELIGPEGKVIGVDPDKERIQLARESHSQIKNLSFAEGSASSFLRMGSNAYDIVFCNAALHWMPEKQQVFNDMFSSLKVGGKIAIHYIDHIPPFEMNAYKELNLENAECICQMYHCEPKSRIEQYCLSAGFKIIKSYETYSAELVFETVESLLHWHWSTTHGMFDLSLVTEERLQRYLALCGYNDDNYNWQGIKVKIPVCRLVAVK